MLLAAYPEAACVADDAQALLPLHLASANQSPTESVSLLIDANPQACRASALSQHGWLPLHFSIEYGQASEIVAKLLTCYPEAARIEATVPAFAHVPSHTQLPLHRALYLGRCDLVALLLEAHPEAARLPDNLRGLVPLQIAIKLSLGVRVVQTLLDSWPEGASCAKDGLCPLHMAVEGHACPRKSPRSSAIDTTSTNIDVDVVRALLSADPSIATVQGTINGLLPIHMACASGAHLNVIKALVEQAPETILTRAGRNAKSMHGMVPLHIILSFAAGEATMHVEPVVRFFLETNRECAQIADSSGRLAVHHALCGGASLDIVRLILTAFPDGISPYR